MPEFNNAEAWHQALRQSVRLPDGFKLASTALEFMPRERPSEKPYPMRLSLIKSDKPSDSFAGVFTRNAFPGAPVLLARERIKGRFAQAFLINNKVSNVGSPSGVEDAKSLGAELATLAGIDAESVFPASTGIIGWSLPVEAMKKALPTLVSNLGKSDALDLARSIMTTDSYPKAFSVLVGQGTITGFAKGAGMIEPNMATMLVFILTDLDQPRDELDEALRAAVNVSFNRISVDSDQSTSDMCFVLSSKIKPRVAKDEFAAALEALCKELSAHVVRNGEGTAHVIRVRVSGFGSDELCRDAGKAIVNSPLVKTAIYGNDPNVGRLISSLGDFMGNKGLVLPANALTLSLCGIEVFSGGAFRIDAQTEVHLSKALSNARQDPEIQGYPQHDRYVDIEVRIANGAGFAEVLGSDLGYEYVKENADYRS